MPYTCLIVGKDYKPGDPKPDGYIERIEWARVQMAAGLRQTMCPKCGKWRFPQDRCDHA